MIVRKSTRAVLTVIAVLVGVWLVAPTLVSIPLSFTDRVSLAFPVTDWSFRWYENFFDDPSWMRPLWASARIALVVALVAGVVGTAAAWGLQSLTGSRTRAWLSGLFIAPVVVPHVILAVGIYSLFLNTGISGTFLGFGLAHSVVAVPFVVITVSASLQSFDRELLKAAASLGATPLKAFARVVLPLIAPGVASGMLFAFVTSFDEVIISMFIQSPQLRTLPVKIFSSIRMDTDPTIAAVATLTLATTTVLFVLYTLALWKRTGKDKHAQSIK